MDTEQSIIPLKGFELDGKYQPISFVSTMDVAQGVTCDVYTFVGDTEKDLGIINIDSGCKTPLQRVLKGDRTVEGYVSGKGRLAVARQNGETEIYEVGSSSQKLLSVDVMIGDTMQWEASADSRLVAYEVCFPPYEDGRYENIEKP